MNRTQIGRLEVTLDGAVKHTIRVSESGRSLKVEGNGFLQTGEYVMGRQEIIDMALRKAVKEYGEKVGVTYYSQ